MQGLTAWEATFSTKKKKEMGDVEGEGVEGGGGVS